VQPMDRKDDRLRFAIYGNLISVSVRSNVSQNISTYLQRFNVFWQTSFTLVSLELLSPSDLSINHNIASKARHTEWFFKLCPPCRLHHHLPPASP